MRLNQRFRRLVFAQVLLGIVAFCIAEPNPGMMLIAGSMAVLSWYITEGPNGTALPRWVINIGSLAAVAWLMVDLFVRDQDHVVIAMGHFTMWLQILLLYTEKSNREYGQLLVLSLMTMIGASILSISMLYGALLAAYCVLGLLTLLQFHLKVTWDQVTDHLRAGAPAGKTVLPPKPIAGRGYAWHFRFLAVCIGFVSAAVAVAVFVATPRAKESPMTGDVSNPLTQKQTGFSDSVQLGTAPKGEGRKEPVLNMSLTLHGSPVWGETLSWLLRGAALDRYDPKTHTWSRSLDASAYDRPRELQEGAHRIIELPGDEPEYEAKITLRQSGFRLLFTHWPTSYIASENFGSVTVNDLDGQIGAAEVVAGAVIYTIRWPLQQRESAAAEPLVAPERRAPGRPTRSAQEVRSAYARGWPVPEQEERLRRHALSVIRRAGLDRDPAQPYDERDAQIANVLAQHLRDNYQYSLEDPPLPQGSDPVIEFLFNHRRGHCEVFASAMAALCRSLNIPARVITGYRASEYNHIGNYYVVRQSNAHAWTEVDCGPELGWRTFDATPPEAVRAEHRVERTWLTSVRELYELLEYQWIRSVVAYDQRTRDAVMEEIRGSIGNKDDRATWLGQVWGFVLEVREYWNSDRLNYTLIFVILVCLAIAIASLTRTMIVRRKRLIALQLTALPRAQRRGLAARLRFYLTMLDMLERNGFVRPSWQSPFSFAQELAEANPMKFDPVVSLTEIFYEIRFGHRNVDDERKQRIKAHLKQLEHALSSR